MRPCILHVDIDAFFASVEQARNPNLRGKPVIVGSGVIASCSYEARAFGLRAGMPLGKAARLCPEAVVLEGHYPTYRCFGDKVFGLCHQFAPQVETHLDEAYCDLTGTEGLYGRASPREGGRGSRRAEGVEPAAAQQELRPPGHAARLLKERIRAETGLSVSIGIGTNRMIAKMATGASRRPDGLFVVGEGAEAEFVRGRPLGDLPGIGAARLAVLQKLNLATIGDLRVLSQEELAALFGRDGLALYERCRGRDSELLGPRSCHGWLAQPCLTLHGRTSRPWHNAVQELPGSISRETAFHEDTADAAVVEGMLYYLTERAARAMRARGLQCRTVGVRIRYSDGESGRKSRSLPAPTRLDSELFALARQMLGEIGRRRASVHSIGLQLSRFSANEGRQAELFAERDPAKLGRLTACVDRLRNRFGHSVIATGKCLEALGGLKKDRYGFVLRTPCLTK